MPFEDRSRLTNFLFAIPTPKVRLWPAWMTSASRHAPSHPHTHTYIHTHILAHTPTTQIFIRHIDKQYPGAAIFLVGFSAGTNIVQKTVLDRDLNVRIRGIMCVCVGRDYLGARNALEDTFEGRIYSRLMTTLCKQIVAKNAHIHAEVRPSPPFTHTTYHRISTPQRTRYP